MESSTRKKIERFVAENIVEFHKNRLGKLRKLKLMTVLRKKNPYLFRAKNITTAANLVESILDAFLSASEEGQFGTFLEHLAIYVAQITCGGTKSSAEGIDLELKKDGVRYLVAIKSGQNWGNSGQHRNLKDNFRKAVRVLKQSKSVDHVQPVLGICYGKFKTKNTGEYLKIGGQSFWHFISGDKKLYIDLIEPLGYEAKKHNESYLKEKVETYNRFTRDFLNDFCKPSGEIDWSKLVKFNSGNLPESTR